MDLIRFCELSATALATCRQPATISMYNRAGAGQPYTEACPALELDLDGAEAPQALAAALEWHISEYGPTKLVFNPAGEPSGSEYHTVFV